MSTDRDTTAELESAQTRFHLSDFTRRQVLARAGVASLAAGLPTFLAACGSGSSSGTATAPAQASDAEIDHMTWGIVGSTPDSLYIANSPSTPGSFGGYLSLECLFAFDPGLHLKPALATSWSQPELLRYEVKLRHGVKFWDGSPLTVEDAVYSVARNMDESAASALGYLFANVKSIEAKDAATIEITLTNPDPTIPQALAITPILPKAFLEKTGAKTGSPGPSGNIIGTGPFKVEAFTAQGLKVSRNESYWGPKPKVKAATINFFQTPETMLLAARSGEIDGGWDYPLGELGSWEKVSDFTTQTVGEDGLALIALTLNLEKEPWNDIHVRKAIAHCCDTAGYANAFLSGGAAPATTIVPPACWGDVATREEVEALYAEVQQYPFDVDAAKAELAKSSSPEGFDATIAFPGTYPAVGKALVNLSDSLQQIGINLHVKQVTENEWLEELFARPDLQMQAMIYVASYPDPAEMLLTFELSTNAEENGLNVANLKNPHIDKLLKEQAATKDNSKRKQLIGEVLKFNGEELPYIPLWWEGPTLAVKNDFVFTGLNGLIGYYHWLSDVAASE